MGDTIRTLRDEAGLTQGQLAKAAGVSTTYIQRLEANDYERPSLKYLTKIAKVFGVTAGYLSGDELLANGNIEKSQIEKEADDIARQWLALSPLARERVKGFLAFEKSREG